MLKDRFRFAIVLFIVTSIAFSLLNELHRAVTAWCALPDRAAALQASIDTLPGKILPQVLGEIDTRASAIAKTADSRLASIEKTADARLGSIQSDAKTLGNQIADDMDKRLGDAIAPLQATAKTVESFRGDLAPALQHASSVAKQVDQAMPDFLDCEYNPDCLFNRYVGTNRAIERMAKSFAESSDDFKNALPGVLADVKTGTGAWAAASLSTQRTMKNLEIATKPLPGWLRIPLSVTGAIAPTATGIVTGLAATGVGK